MYITGGGSELPLVARALKERFGRKVRRSPYTRSATAIGLAIQADEQSGYVLREHFTRHFGVWREAEGGRLIIFDPLFEKGTALPGPLDPPVTLSRTYTPVHNIGHFRYLECSHRDPDGQPVGDLQSGTRSGSPSIPRCRTKPTSRPLRWCTAMPQPGSASKNATIATPGGTVTVTILNLTSNYERGYRLGRWAGKDGRVVPGRRRRASARR